MKSDRETYTSKLLGWNEVKFGTVPYISWRNPLKTALASHARYVLYPACAKPPLKASLSTRDVTKMFRYVSARSSINTHYF